LLVFTWMWVHEAQETLVTLTFKAAGKGTEMTLQHTNFASAERRDSHNNGSTGSFDKSAEVLTG
jgi:Activator of Hsp90 ATPase homolog 1-like protein